MSQLRSNVRCIKRIKKDLENFALLNPEGISIVPDEEDMTKLHALIVGPRDTPYEGGFFYFIVQCTSEYPFCPPKVTFMTTDGSTVRFNPNLYKNGKVCLSILGTFVGTDWVPSIGLGSLLISIQSLLSEYPFHNTPTYEDKIAYKDSAEAYNKVIRHETMRVAVVKMMEKPPATFPQELRIEMEKSFKSNYPHYVSTCVNNKHLNGIKLLHLADDDLAFGYTGKITYGSILLRLKKVKETLLCQKQSHGDDDEPESSDAPADSTTVSVKYVTAEFTALNAQNDTAGTATSNVQGDTAVTATSNVQGATEGPGTSNVQGATTK